MISICFVPKITQDESSELQDPVVSPTQLWDGTGNDLEMDCIEALCFLHAAEYVCQQPVGRLLNKVLFLQADQDVCTIKSKHISR